MQKCVKFQHLEEQYGQHPIVLKAGNKKYNHLSRGNNQIHALDFVEVTRLLLLRNLQVHFSPCALDNEWVLLCPSFGVWRLSILLLHAFLLLKIIVDVFAALYFGS